MAIYQKRESAGVFLKKGVDFKENDILEIASEGKPVEGLYGKQDVFLVKTPDGKEGNVSFNSTTINALIDAYGTDSKKWIGKEAKVWTIVSNIQGKMRKVYYFTSPDAELTDEGNFSVPEKSIDLDEDTFSEDFQEDLD
jgi:hypothetical protein